MSQNYQPYEEYKDSGVEWLGDIPGHWDRSRLGFETTVKARLGWKGLKAEEYVDDGYIFLATPNIKDNVIDFKNVNFITRERYDESPEIKLQTGDVLVTKDGSTTGTCNVVRSLPRPATVNSSIAVIRPGKQLVSEYLYYFFASPYTQNVIKLMQGGMGVPHLFQADLRWFHVLLPPLQEQRTIAAFLDHETARIDLLIAKQRRLIELLKEKRQAVISHAVTKGLNPNVPMKDSGVEWLGEVPEHWVVSRIKNFSKIESGHTPDKKKEEYWQSSDIPWVSLNDSKTLKLVDYIDDTVFKVNAVGIANSSARLLPERAVVFTRDASIGLSAITTKVMAVSQHLIAWICEEEKLSPEFLLLVFYGMEKEFERYTFGATIKTIGMDDVRSLSAAVPPISEQHLLAEWAFQKIAELKVCISKAEQTMALLKERRTALISAAVTGKIDLRGWQAPAGSANSRQAPGEWPIVAENPAEYGEQP